MLIQTLRFEPNPPPTAEAVMALISGWTDLTQTRRRELGSALSAVAEMAGLPPASLLLTPATLRPLVLNQSAATWGIKEASKGNIRSRLRFILRRLDLIEAAETPLTDTWRILLDKLKPLHRSGMIAFARDCSMRGIEAAAVTHATFVAFMAHLEARTLTPQPRKRVGDLRKSWNQACDTVPNWPTGKIPRIVASNHYVLPLDAFPASFRADLAAFGRHLGGSLLDEAAPDLSSLDTAPILDDDAPLNRPPRPLRATTVALRLSHCRWAASALVASGVPVASVTSLACLLTPLERGHAILQFLYLRAGRKASAAGMHVADTLRILARYYLTLPAASVDWIKKWGKAVALSYQGMTDKNERTIAAAMQPDCERRLIELPDAYMAAARLRLATAPREAADLALRALAIEILTTYPFRLANLLGLRFDRHLHRANPRGPVTGILISGDEVKNAQKITLPISARLGRFIEEWTTRFRGIIAAPDCRHLFPGYGTGAQPITPQGLRKAIKDATGDYVGVVLTPHQFRHLAAARFRAAYPGQDEALRQLLGHKSVETTRRAYCSKDSTPAMQSFDALITHQRTTLRRGGPAPAPGLTHRGSRGGRR